MRNLGKVTPKAIVKNLIITDDVATMRKHVTEMFISYLIHNDCDTEEKLDKERTYAALDFALEEIGNLMSKKTA